LNKIALSGIPLPFQTAGTPLYKPSIYKGLSPLLDFLGKFSHGRVNLILQLALTKSTRCLESFPDRTN
jgi:hypothetical protein